MAELGILTRLQGNASAGLQQLRGDIEGLEGSTGTAGRGFAGLQTIGTAALKAIAVSVVAVVVALGAMAASSFNEARTFEESIAIMSTAVDESAGSMEDLRAAALQVGGDVDLVGVSASSAAESITNLAKAGLTGTQIFGDMQGYLAGTAELSGALRASIDLAAASELDMVQASDLAAVALNTFGGALESEAAQAEFINAAMNNFVQTANSSATSVSDLADALKNVGPTAAQFGFSLEDTNTALAILSTRGITGAEAGTALKSMLTNMMRTTPAVTSALDDLGIALYDSEGAMRSLPDIIADTSAAMEGLTEEQRNNYIQTLAGTFGMKAMATLLAEGTEGWDKMTSAIEGAASIQEVAAARTQTFNGAMEAFGGVIETIQIGLGSAFLPIMTMLVHTLADFGDRAGPIAIRAAEGIATAISAFIDALSGGDSLLSAFSVLIMDVGQVLGLSSIEAQQLALSFLDLVTGVSNFVGPIAELIGRFFEFSDVLTAVALVLGGVIVVALAGVVASVAPVILIFGAIVAAVALLRTAWESNFAGIQDIVANVVAAVEGFRDAFALAMEGGATPLEALGEAFAALGVNIDPLIGFLESVGEKVSGFVAAIQEGETPLESLRLAFESIGINADPLIAFFESIGAAVGTFVTSIQEGESPLESLRLAFESLGINADPLISFFERIGEKVGTFVAAIQDGEAPLEGLRTALESIGINADPLIAFFESIGTAVGTFVTSIQEGEAPLEALRLAFESIGVNGEPLVSFLETLGAAMGVFVTALLEGQAPLDAIKLALAEFGVSAETVQGFVDNLNEKFTTIAGILSDVFSPTIDRIKESFSGLGENLAPVGEHLGALGESFQRLLTALAPVGQVIAGVVVVAIKLLGEIIAQVFENAGTIIGGFLDFTTGIFDSLAAVFEGLVGFITNAFAGDWDAAFESLIGGVEGFVEGIQTTFEGMLDVVDGILGSLIDAIINTINDLTGSALGGWDDFKEAVVGVFEDLFDILVGNSIVPDMIDAIIDVFAGLGQSVVEAIADFKQGVIDVFESVKEKAIDAFDQMKEGVSTAWDAMREIFDALVEFITGEISWDEFKEAAAGAWEGIQSAVDTFWGVAETIFDSVVTAAEDIKTGISDMGTKWGEIWEAAKSKIAEVSTPITEFFDKVKDFGAWLSTNVFNFELNLPELPDWAIPGSPIKLHTALMGFASFLSATSFGMDFAVTLNGDPNANMDGLMDEMLIDPSAATEMAGALQAVSASVGPAIAALLAIFDFDIGTVHQRGLVLREFAQLIQHFVGQFAVAASALKAQSAGWALTEAEEMASAVEGVAAAVMVALDALDALSGYTVPNVGATVQALVGQVGYLVAQMALVAVGMSEEALTHVQVFTAAATAVLEVVQPGIEALRALAGYVAVDISSQMSGFSTQIGIIVGYLALVAVQFGGDALAHAETFADTASALIDLIQPGIEAIQLLSEYVAVNLGFELQSFVSFVKVLAMNMADAASSFGADVLEHAAQFADTAGGMLDLIVPGIEAVAALEEYTHVNLGFELQSLVSFVKVLVMNLTEAASQFSENALAQAEMFANAAGSLLDLVRPGINAIVDIVEYEAAEVAPIQGAFGVDLVALIVMLVATMESVASQIAQDAMSAAVQIAENAEALLGIVGTAVEALAALAEYSSIGSADVALSGFYADLEALIVGLEAALNGVAEQLGLEVVTAAGAMAIAAGNLLEIVSPAIEAIGQVADYERIGYVTILMSGFYTDLQALVEGLVDVFERVAGRLGVEVVGAAGAMATAVSELVAVVGPAIESIGQIANYERIGYVTILMSGFYTDMQALVEGLVDVFERVTERLGLDAVTAASAMATAVSGLVTIVGPAIEAIGQIASYEQIGYVTILLSGFYTDLQALVTGLVEMFQRIAERLGVDAVNAAASMATAVGTLVGVIEPAIAAIGLVANYEAVGAAQVALSAFFTELEALVQGLVDAFEGVAQNIGVDAVNAATQIATAVSTLATTTNSILTSLGEIAGSAQPDTSGALDYLVAQADLLAIRIQSSSSTVNGSVVSAANDFASAVSDVKDQVLAALDTMSAIVSANAPGSLNGILDAMIASLNNTATPAQNAGAAIGEAFKSGILGALEAMLVAVGGIIAQLIGLLTQNSNVASANTAGANIGNALAAGINSASGAVQSAATSIAQNAVNAMVSAVQAGQGALSGAIQVMMDSAVAAAEGAWEIASPSKVFTRISENAVASARRPWERPAALSGAVGAAFGRATQPLAMGAISRSTTSYGDTINLYLTVPDSRPSPELKSMVKTVVGEAMTEAGRRAEIKVRTR